MSFPQYYIQIEDAEGNYVQLLVESIESTIDEMIEQMMRNSFNKIVSSKKYSMVDSNGRLVFQELQQRTRGGDE